MKKFLSALLLFALLATGLSSCQTQEVKKMKVKLTVTAGDDPIYERELTLDGETASVYQVVERASDSGLNVTFSQDGKSISHFAQYNPKTLNGFSYAWYYTINGEEPQKGTASDNMVSDGSEILYQLWETNIHDTKDTHLYKSETNAYGELGEESSSAET